MEGDLESHNSSSILEKNSSNISFFDPPVEDLEIVKNRRFNNSSIKIKIINKGKDKKTHKEFENAI
jgi:hypothetical protein